MKTINRIALASLLMLVLVACDDGDNIIEFVNTHKKPIVVKRGTTYLMDGKTEYTLYSADGAIYYSDRTGMVLPDTILATKLPMPSEPPPDSLSN